MLVCRLWHATQLTTGNLVVLHLNLGNNIGRYQIVFIEFLRVQPDTHGVVMHPERAGIAHALHTEDYGQHIDTQVVFDKGFIVFIVRRIETNHHQGAGLPLTGGDPGTGYFRWQQAGGGRHAVLNVYGRHVGVRALAEINSDVSPTVVGGARSHVIHVLDPVDSIFQWGDDAVGDGLGIGTDICSGYLYGRRRDIVLVEAAVIRNKRRYHQNITARLINANPLLLHRFR